MREGLEEAVRKLSEESPPRFVKGLDLMRDSSAEAHHEMMQRGVAAVVEHLWAQFPDSAIEVVEPPQATTTTRGAFARSKFEVGTRNIACAWWTRSSI